jgi:hypothetical protein
MHRTLSRPRMVATGVLLAAAPAAVLLPPMAGLAGLVAILIALIVVETTRYERRPMLVGADQEDQASIRE